MSQSLIIKGLCPGLTERGKVKIGEKGRMITSAKGNQFQPPQKLDHFRVTTLFRGTDGNFQTDAEIHGRHGEKPRVLPVRLLYDEIDLNFQCRYVCFNGKTMWCAGDGESASRIHASGQGRGDVPCPCGRQDPSYTGADRCKINGTLSVIIDGSNSVGGVWKFRTTSYNSVVGILSSLALIKRLTGGPLAGLPLHLTLNPKTVITPTDGKSMNVWVVGLEFRGTVEDLQKIGYEKAKSMAVHYAKIEQIEQEARRLISASPLILDGDDPQEIIEEFYPEQVTIVSNDPIIPSEKSIEVPENGTPVEAVVDVPVTDQVEEQKPEPARRRRANKFVVDPEEWNGKSELLTCGADPLQILALRTHAKTPESRQFILQWIKETTGYTESSYLTKQEAETLIGIITKSVGKEEVIDQAPQEDVGEVITNGRETVVCPYSKEPTFTSFCKSECDTRKQDGFCPVVDDVQGGGLI